MIRQTVVILGESAAGFGNFVLQVNIGRHKEVWPAIVVEVAHHGRPAECHGDEAAAFLSTLLPTGTTITLHRDDEARDVYGRLLAYVVTSDGRSVNLAIAAEGHAIPLAMAPNLALADRIAAAAADARTAGLGLWQRCPVDT